MAPSNDLRRFLAAQDRDYERALAEIRRGRKTSHWMWYVFPQLQGLGHSETARHYALRDGAEADAYLRHPVLGARLVEISAALLLLPEADAHAVFGSPDDLKLRSSMTLFSQVAGADPVFQNVLQKFFNGRPDTATLELLRRA